VADIVAREALRLKEFGREFGPGNEKPPGPEGSSGLSRRTIRDRSAGNKPGSAVLSLSFQRISMKNLEFDRVDESSLPATRDFTGSTF
jgi:hypothetical protein